MREAEGMPAWSMMGSSAGDGIISGKLKIEKRTYADLCLLGGGKRQSLTDPWKERLKREGVSSGEGIAGGAECVWGGALY